MALYINVKQVIIIQHFNAHEHFVLFLILFNYSTLILNFVYLGF